MPKLPRAIPASWSTHAKFTGQVEAVDPVRAHGVTETMHPHQFFGALNITPNTTPAKLRAAGDAITQGIPDPHNDGAFLPDNSGYWAPCLYATEDRTNPVHPEFALAYYRSGGIDPRTIARPPQDLALLAGNPMAMIPSDNPQASWAVVTGTVGDHSPTIPTSCPVANAAGEPYLLRMTVHFPNCIKVRSVYDFDFTPESAYAVSNPSYGITSPYPLIAPDGYEAIPQLDLVIRYRLDKDFPISKGIVDLSGAVLASDMPCDGDCHDHGLTAHADFMSGWSKEILETLISSGYHAEPPHNLGRVMGPGNV